MPTHAEDIIEITEKIELQLGGHAYHKGTTPCRAAADLLPNGVTMKVETFELSNYPKSKLAYAWKLKQELRMEESRIIIRPHISPDTSPYDAFKNWLEANYNLY